MDDTKVIPQADPEPSVAVEMQQQQDNTADETKKDTPSSPKSAERMKRAEFLGNGPLVKTIWSLTYPDFIAKLVGALYNLVDSMFIGQYAGSTVEEKKLSLVWRQVPIFRPAGDFWQARPNPPGLGTRFILAPQAKNFWVLLIDCESIHCFFNKSSVIMEDKIISVMSKNGISLADILTFAEKLLSERVCLTCFVIMLGNEG